MFDDGWKIIIGLIMGIGLFLSPFIYNGVKASKTPELELTAKAKEAGECVEDTAFMRTSHMKLLDKWRNSVVRDGERYYTAGNGKVYYKSLERTCMDCHSNKTRFCDQCHNYMAVTPTCWDCHIAPEESK